MKAISALTESGKKVLTMDEYIKKLYAVDAVLDVYYDTPDIDLSGEKFEAAILKIQATDVAPVRHGRWIKHDDGVFTCSECGNAESNESYFCRYCGAKMMEG